MGILIEEVSIQVGKDNESPSVHHWQSFNQNSVRRALAVRSRAGAL
jgi:hypothetical protein